MTNTTITVLSATIAGLAENTEYEVQVRATNAEGTSGWSPSGSGATDANAAPSFDSPTTFDAAGEPDGGGHGGGVGQRHGRRRGDRLRARGGADQSFFSIDRDTGVLTFKAAPNYEAPSDADTNGGYVVTVQATSGTGDREQTATRRSR